MNERVKRNLTAKENQRILDEMLEMSNALEKHALISKPDAMRIRTLCQKPPVFSSQKVAQIRKNKARMSQSVFASFLNVSVSTVQKWEAPESGKHPSGAAAKLLQVIERKGIEAIAT